MAVEPDGPTLRVAVADGLRPGPQVRRVPLVAAADPLRVVVDLASVEVFLGTASVTELLPAVDEPWSVGLAGPGPVGPVSVHPLDQGNWRQTT